MKQYFIAIALLCSLAACKKESKSLPTSMQIVTNGYGHTNNSGYVESISIINKSGSTIFHLDTLKFNTYAITYNVNVNPGDVLKIVVNSNITNLQAQAPSVDVQFVYNGTSIYDMQGGVYNTNAFYGVNTKANIETITIPISK